jgi:tetratricopeptide (TPR) repeat protein
VFYRTWNRAGRWAAVISPPGDFPATAQPLPYLEAAQDLEVTGQRQAAFRAYRAVSKRWPEQPAAFLGMGNIAFAQQEWVQAVRYYAATVENFPGLAPGWNNLAHALARSGCASQSVEALACANELRPDGFPLDLPTSDDASGSTCPVFNCPVID